MIRTIVLAYSGGLDTSIIVPWLREHYGARVICVAADIGQGRRARAACARRRSPPAPRSATSKTCARSSSRDFVLPDAPRRRHLRPQVPPRHLHGAAAHRQAPGRGRARRVGADALAHGCTGKGNDQVRFELTYAAFAPGSPGHRAVARVGHPQPRGRDRTTPTAHAFPSPRRKEKIYSRDRNLWHLSHEGGVLEDPDSAPPDDLFMLTHRSDARAGRARGRRHRFRARARRCRSTARRSIAGRARRRRSTRSAARHGVGRIDLVEDRLVGMKSRGVYETPGGTLLYTAHCELEQLVLDRRTLAAKDLIAPRYADLVYEGRWWTTEREAYDAFVNVTQQRVTGTVTLRLFKGTVHRSSAARASTRSTTSASSPSARTTSTSRATPPASSASSASPRACARSRIRSCADARCVDTSAQSSRRAAR